MKLLLGVQAALTLLGFGLLWLLNAQQNSLSFAYGSALSLANLGLLTWLWNRILRKKLIALAVLIIVFKYAIFGIIIYKILTSPGVDALWFSVGLSTLIVSVLFFTLFGGAIWRMSDKKDTDEDKEFG